MLTLWFATGAVLSFVPFPLLNERDRLSSSEGIDLRAVSVTPARALAAAGTTTVQRLRLISVVGKPRYVLSPAGQPVLSVCASSGERLAFLPPEQAAAVAGRFAGRPIASLNGPEDYDQWTVHERYDTNRPYYRASIDDESGTVLYVSARSGEVMQRTTRNERAWNRVGAVIHWLNPTTLRKHDELWHATLWSLALAGIALISMGTWLGVVRYVNLKRSGRSGMSPFVGWMRWHHTVGLFAAVIALNWMASGWLSIDRGTFFSSDQPTAQQVERLRGMTVAEAAQALFSAVDSQKLAGARDIEFTALGGRPLLIVRDGSSRYSYVVSNDVSGNASTSAVIPDALLRSAIRAAWSPVGVRAMDAIAEDDAYRLRTVPWPATARRAVLNDPGHTWVQIDAASGQIISIMDTSRRVYRWVVAGPHNLDFPLFNHAEPLRHILILVATGIGFVLSCTGVVLGVRRVRSMLAP